MVWSRYWGWLLCGWLVGWGLVQEAGAQAAENDFHRGYYRQQQGDFEGALTAYKAALTDDATPELRRKILRQLDDMSAVVAARDLARLMPADTIAYFELARPADHLERLARLMGLVGHEHTGDRVWLPMDDGLAIPSDFQLSPLLLSELKKISGVAVAVTDIDVQREEPAGVFIIHAGESDLIRGLIDTGMQVVPRQQSIGGYQTFCIEDEVWLAKSGALIIGSDQRAHIADVLRRLEGGEDSLADSPQFQERAEQRENALVFAYVNGPELMRRAGPLMDQEEAAMARVVLGLDQLQHITAMIGLNEKGPTAELTCAYTPGHSSLAYGFMRTVPLQDETLRRIPSGAAVVAALGVNPQLGSVATMAHPEHLSGLDIGRELFANIKDVGLFVLPSLSPHGDEVPDFGIVFATHDAAKSEQLWNQMLSLPAKIHADQGIRSEEKTIAGRKARSYVFDDDDAPELTIVRLDEDAIVMGTEAAVTLAAATAAGKHASLAADEGFAAIAAARDDNTAKAVFAHVGRALQMAAQIEGDDEVEQLARVLDNMRVAITSEESPSQLTIRVQASGLPVFEEVIKSVAHVQQHEMSVAEK